jgi:8-oxo-dGTP diphosphatase
MKFDRAVAVYIINSINEILLLKHKKFNVWLPPGGHVEENELIHEAAIREVEEEAGVHIEFINLCYTLEKNDDKRAKLLPSPMLVQLENVGDHYHEDFVYLAKAKTTKILNHENHEIDWFSFDLALNLETFENVKRHLIYIRTLLSNNMTKNS